MNFFKPNEEENNHRVDDDEYEEELDFEVDDDIPREEDEDFQSDDDYNPVKVALKTLIFRKRIGQSPIKFFLTEISTFHGLTSSVW